MLIKLNGFNWKVTAYDKQGQIVDQWQQHNLIPSEGLSFLSGAPFGDTSSISNFYCGVFKGNYVPSKATKASDIPNIGEIVNYSEQNRPVWSRVRKDEGTYSNADNPAIFTFTEEQTINGFFLVSSDIKGSGNGTLLSILRLSTPRTVSSKLEIVASLSYVSGTTL